jgi:hypothetical protein
MAAASTRLRRASLRLATRQANRKMADRPPWPVPPSRSIRAIKRKRELPPISSRVRPYQARFRWPLYSSQSIEASLRLVNSERRTRIGRSFVFNGSSASSLGDDGIRRVPRIELHRNRSCHRRHIRRKPRLQCAQILRRGRVTPATLARLRTRPQRSEPAVPRLADGDCARS